MHITAESRYIRVSPRKMQLLVRSMKSFKPAEVVTKLEFIKKSGSEPLRKVILSALANARQKNIEVGTVLFKEIQVLPGSSMKRFRAVSRGMAHTYKKRMSHVKVILTDEQSVKKNQVKELKPKTEEDQKPKITVQNKSVKVEKAE